jgi:DNA-directed RNA polymerase specialized sigma24 family protein
MIEEADGSVTRWIEDLKDGRREALDQLWGRYFGRLVLLARARLRSTRGGPGVADEEDAALSALNSLWERASDGRLPGLADRDELWRLLVVITARKTVRQVEREGRKKRGGGRVLNEAMLASAGGPAEGDGDNDLIARLADTEPTPEFAAMVAEETARRLDALPDPVLRQVALRRMEGFSNEEIAEQLGCVPRTVERKLEVIRKLWKEDASP